MPFAPDPPAWATPAALSTAPRKVPPAGALPTNPAVVPPVTLLKVNRGGTPPPPLVVKLKVPGPPMVFLATVSVASPWLVKLQLPLAPPVVKARLPQPPLSAKPAALSSATPKLAPAEAPTTHTYPGTPVTLLQVKTGGRPARTEG